MALSRATPRKYEAGGEIDGSYPVLTNTVIYEGGLISLDANGLARPAVATDPFFAGIALEDVNNNPGASGAKQVRVRKQGRVELPVTSVAATSHGAAVYCGADDELNLTATSRLGVGRVDRFISSGVCIVAFQASSLNTLATAEV